MGELGLGLKKMMNSNVASDFLWIFRRILYNNIFLEKLGLGLWD